ncbi:hypothetical protein JQ620_11595 [Bradyrhizobium sp. AUGA SZCCT0274]|nr:hypothetical protein [Bradyrhizobium sp. AUGA SZCCT0274]MBR1240772.1 hypothetical protein [Bradyrhizobium sp. AUGA SZCCT0274]
MRAIYNTATEIIKRCRPVVDGGGSYDPYAGMAVTDCLVVLEKLKEILDGQIALPISQWDRELAIDALERQHFPALWQLCVWLSAAWHQLEDVMELRQAMMRFVSMGEIFENRRWAGEQLNRLGIINALHVYRDARLRGLTEPDQGIIAEACAEGLRDFGHETEDRARRAVNAGDLTPDARYLDAKDVMHLGLHSQMRRVGGVFLSHRGPDCKRALMDLYGKPRPTIFLDIWARPRGDTNRRFLWRNLGASEEMHAFVTTNYAASNYCLKEVEAWGLLSAARGHSPEATPAAPIHHCAPGHCVVDVTNRPSSRHCASVVRRSTWLKLHWVYASAKARPRRRLQMNGIGGYSQAQFCRHAPEKPLPIFLP